MVVEKDIGFAELHVMKPFDIGVDTPQGTRYFEVIPSTIAGDTQYEIWEDSKHLFSLECCFDAVGDSLKLSPEFAGKGIEPALIDAVVEIIQSEEE